MKSSLQRIWEREAPLASPKASNGYFAQRCRQKLGASFQVLLLVVSRNGEPQTGRTFRYSGRPNSLDINMILLEFFSYGKGFRAFTNHDGNNLGGTGIFFEAILAQLFFKKSNLSMQVYAELRF